MASLCRMPREPTSLPKRSRKVTASSDFFSQSSSEVSRNAGSASASITIMPPSPSVAASDSGSPPPAPPARDGEPVQEGGEALEVFAHPAQREEDRGIEPRVEVEQEALELR